MKKNEKSMLEFLKEYGIDIEKIAKDKIDDLIKDGYEKIPDDAKETIDAVLQYIPGLAVDAFERKDAVKKSKKLLEGAYRVSITDGMHLAKSKASKGAYRGSLLSNVNNQVAGQAELFRIEDTLKLVQAPRYALCVFDAVSAITGQYYMAEINHRLSDIETKTGRILDYLENTIRGELWANDQVLSDIVKNIDYINTNETARTSFYQQVLTIKKDALSKMMFFDLQINSSRKKITTKSSETDIEEMTKKVAEYYPQYWYTIYLYAKSIFCEISLAKIDDPIVLSNMKNDIQMYINKYKNAFEIDRREISKVVDNAKTYNLKKLPRVGHSRAYKGIADVLIGLYDLSASIEHVVADQKNSKKNKLIADFNKEMDDFGDVSLLSEQVERIDNQIKRVSNPIDIIQVGDETYIKYLNSNEVEKESNEL